MIYSHTIEERWSILRSGSISGIFMCGDQELGKVSVYSDGLQPYIDTCHMRSLVDGQKIAQEIAARAVLFTTALYAQKGMAIYTFARFYTLSYYSTLPEHAENVNAAFRRLGFVEEEVDELVYPERLDYMTLSIPGGMEGILSEWRDLFYDRRAASCGEDLSGFDWGMAEEQLHASLVNGRKRAELIVPAHDKAPPNDVTLKDLEELGDSVRRIQLSSSGAVCTSG